MQHEQVLSLPMHPFLTDGEVEAVIDAVRRAASALETTDCGHYPV